MPKRMNQDIYPYSEDSALLAEAISESDGGESFLEIGIGGGGNLVLAMGKFTFVVGTDIFSPAKFPSVPLDAEIVCTDRATCFREAVFDLVAFNPPYLPSESIEDIAVDGGPSGADVPLKFLESALEVLKIGGKILVLLSSLGAIETFAKYCEKHSLITKKVAEKKLFFETLVVYAVSRI
jgi:release factor glutamine methyltransferase